MVPSVVWMFAIGSMASIIVIVQKSEANEDAKRLYDDLLVSYNRHRRPSRSPREPINIKLKLRLSQIIDVHEIDQIMTCSVWLKQVWTDEKLRWDPTDYGGVSVLYVPHEMIWTPDIVLYNNAESNYNITISTKATLYYTGQVSWEPPAIFKSLCQLDVRWFPFDEQQCHLKFGSWSYSENLLNLELLDGNATYMEFIDENGVLQNSSVVKNGIDLSDYYPSVEWDIMSRVARRRSKAYPGCCPGEGNFVDIMYFLVLRRKPLFYTVNLVFPCVGISFLTIMVFYLPSDSGEKISLCISILVAITVFFLLLTEIIPATSISLPLIGKYLLFTMVMVTLSVLITVISLNFHFRKPTTHHLSGWMRWLFLDWLPKLLFMRRPPHAFLIPSPYAGSGRSAGDGSQKHRHESQNRMINGYSFGVGGVEQAHYPPRRWSLAPPILSKKLVAGGGKCANVSNIVGGEPVRLSYEERQISRNLDRILMRTSIGGPGLAGSGAAMDERLKKLYYSPSVVKAFENICFIAELLKKEDRDNRVEEDWKYVAMVVDRLFLITFSVVCVFGTVFILLQAPTFYDGKRPIDLQIGPNDTTADNHDRHFHHDYYLL